MSNLNIAPPSFHFASFRPPSDSGQKVWLANYLWSLLPQADEQLIWIGNWDVWPSSQHLPLLTRFREALGETRTLPETPGHLISAEDGDDAVSIICMALFFMWDCRILSGTGRDAIFISHDEYGWFASKEFLVAESIRKQLTQAGL